MKKLIYIAIAAFALYSCKSEPIETIGPQGEIEVDTEDQTTDFQNSGEASDVDMAILEELNICEMIDTLPAIADCTADNFKILQVSESIPKSDAFIVVAKAGIALKGAVRPLPPVRHIFIYARDNGQLVQTNGFRGDIIASQKGEKGNDIVLALYLKEDETLFHCLYKWDGERYSFESIEGLDWGEGVKTLRAEDKDSVSNDIYNSIMNSNLVF